MESLAQHLDFANHHANSTPEDIRKLCEDVVSYGFHAVFVNAQYVALAKDMLAGKAPVGTVISFPLGQDTLSAKMAAANEAVADGADELDIVPNIGLFMAGDETAFLDEMQRVVESARMLGRAVIVKFILDPGYFDALPDREAKLARAAECVRAAGADFVKIGSGMGPRNPSLEDLRIVKDAVGGTVRIKVAGGIVDRKTAEAFLAGGADRLGTSHAIKIVKETSDAPSSGRKAPASE